MLFAVVLLRYSFGLIDRTWDVESIALPITAAALYIVMPLAGPRADPAGSRRSPRWLWPAGASPLRNREPSPYEHADAADPAGLVRCAAARRAALRLDGAGGGRLRLRSAAFPLGIVPQKIAQSANSFPLLAAPLFILMGNIMNSAGITDRIFTFATACVGWLRGGLCHANILASVIFAGMSGSAVADAGGVGTLEIKAMRDEGYDAETAAAITAASATIGPIIPPSLPMVIYGVSADVSIGGLFLAGVIPGLLMAGALMAMVVVCRDASANLPRHPFPGFARALGAPTRTRTGR